MLRPEKKSATPAQRQLESRLSKLHEVLVIGFVFIICFAFFVKIVFL